MLSSERIVDLFTQLNGRLAREDVEGELYVVGGAVMTLAFDFVPWLDLDHLKVFVAAPEYLLAMKCVAFRLGPEFHDEDDVRFLLRHLRLAGC